MPRTKPVRKQPSSVTECETMMRDFHHQSTISIRKLDTDFNNTIETFGNQIDLALSRLPMEIRRMTLEELLNLELPNEGEVNPSDNSCDSQKMEPPRTIKKSRKLKRQTAASTDDGYVTESVSSNANQFKHVSRVNAGRSSSILSTASSVSTASATTKRTRSSSRSKKPVLPSAVEESAKKRSSSTSRINSKLFTTPAVSKFKTEYDCVTPKVKPNTPLNLLRRPKDGEMVLSMQGSPLLVATSVQDKTANVNVPLTNGSIISLLPTDGLRLSQVPRLDSETMEQLKTLQKNLEKVIASN